MILDIMFTFYCMKFYQRHHLMSKSFSPPQRRHGVCVTISIYTLVLPIYVLFLCDFTCVVWLMGQLWPFCVNKMTTTTTTAIIRTTILIPYHSSEWWWTVRGKWHPETNSRHSANCVVTGGWNNNLLCQLWRQSCHHDSDSRLSIFSVLFTGSTCSMTEIK